MKKASLIAAVLLLQIFLPLVSQASPEEKAVGKAAIFYQHLNIARGLRKSPNQGAEISKKPSEPVHIIPKRQTQPEPVKTNPAQSSLAK